MMFNKIINRIFKRLNFYHNELVIIRFFNNVAVVAILLVENEKLYFEVKKIKRNPNLKLNYSFKLNRKYPIILSLNFFPYEVKKHSNGHIIAKIDDEINYLFINNFNQEGVFTLYWEKQQIMKTVYVSQYFEEDCGVDFLDDDDYEGGLNYYLAYDLLELIRKEEWKKIIYKDCFYNEFIKVIEMRVIDIRNFENTKSIYRNIKPNDKIGFSYYNAPYKAEINGKEIYNTKKLLLDFKKNLDSKYSKIIDSVEQGKTKKILSFESIVSND